MTEIKAQIQRPSRIKWGSPFKVWQVGTDHPYPQPGHVNAQYAYPDSRKCLKTDESFQLFMEWYEHGLPTLRERTTPVALDAKKRKFCFSTSLDLSRLSISGKEIVMSDGRIESPFRGQEGFLKWCVHMFAAFACGAIQAHDALGKTISASLGIAPNVVPLYAKISPDIKNKLGWGYFTDWTYMFNAFSHYEMQKVSGGKAAINKEAVRDYVVKGHKNLRQAADRFGCTREYVRQVLFEFGINIKAINKASRSKAKSSAKDKPKRSSEKNKTHTAKEALQGPGSSLFEYNPASEEESMIAREIENNWDSCIGIEGQAKLTRKMGVSYLGSSYSIVHGLGLAEELGWVDIEMSYDTFEALKITLEEDAGSFHGIDGQIRLARTLGIEKLSTLYFAVSALGRDKELAFRNIPLSIDDFKKLRMELKKPAEYNTGIDAQLLLAKRPDLKVQSLGELYLAAEALGLAETLKWKNIELPAHVFERLKEELEKNSAQYAGNLKQPELARACGAINLAQLFSGVTALGYTEMLKHEKIDLSVNEFDDLAAFVEKKRADLGNFKGFAGMVNMAILLRIPNLKQIYSGIKALGLADELEFDDIDLKVSTIKILEKELRKDPAKYKGNKNQVALANKYRISHLDTLYRAVSVFFSYNELLLMLEWEHIDLPVRVFERMKEELGKDPEKYAHAEGQIKLAKLLGISDLSAIFSGVHALKLVESLGHRWIPLMLKDFLALREKIKNDPDGYSGDINQVRLAKDCGIDDLWAVYMAVRALGLENKLGYHEMFITTDQFEALRDELKNNWAKYKGDKNQVSLAQMSGIFSLKWLYNAVKALGFAERLGYHPVDLSVETFEMIKKELESNWQEYAGDENQVKLADQFDIADLGVLYGAVLALGFAEKLGYVRIDLPVNKIRGIMPRILEWAKNNDLPLDQLHRYKGNENQIAFADRLKVTNLGDLYGTLLSLGLADWLGYQCLDLPVEALRGIFEELIVFSKEQGIPFETFSRLMRGENAEACRTILGRLKNGESPDKLMVSMGKMDPPKKPEPTAKEREAERRAFLTSSAIYATSPEGEWLKKASGIKFQHPTEMIDWILAKRPKKEANTVLFLIHSLSHINGHVWDNMERWKVYFRAYSYLSARPDLTFELNRAYMSAKKDKINIRSSVIRERIDTSKFTGLKKSSVIPEKSLIIVLGVYLALQKHFAGRMDHGH